MTTDRLIPVATFATPEEAEIGRRILEIDGIPSVLQDASTLGWFWHLGNATGWIKLLVAEELAQQAANRLRAEPDLPTASQSPEPWTCNCGADVDAGFDICWLCGEARSEVSGITFVRESRQSHREIGMTTEDKSAGEAIDRAYRAAIFGCFTLPVILHFYSLIILIQNLNAPLDGRASRRFYASWLINATAVALAVYLVR
jgi:hypothetical protein